MNLKIGILFVVGMIGTTLAILINNLLIKSCGIFLAWWCGMVVSTMLWSIVYSILERTFPEKNL
jgi:hypothetical protein